MKKKLFSLEKYYLIFKFTLLSLLDTFLRNKTSHFVFVDYAYNLYIRFLDLLTKYFTEDMMGIHFILLYVVNQ